MTPEPSVRRMPQPRFEAKVAPRTVTELVMRYESFKKDEAKVRELYPWADRFVLGQPLAPWQRPFKWSEEQQVRFITSMWLRVDIGSYMVNDPRNPEFSEDGRRARFLTDVVLDGQQRLTALENYLDGKFAVPDASGVPVHWHELSVVEQRFFRNMVFSRATVSSYDETELREIYDLRNFGGVAHLESERASGILPSN